MSHRMPADTVLVGARPGAAALGGRHAAVAALQAPFARWVLWAGLGTLLVVLSGVGLDHPVARYVHQRVTFSHDARRMVHIPELVILAAAAGTVLLGAWSAFVGRLGGIWRQLLLASISVCIAITLTDLLKVWFGRIPPLRWYDQQWRNFYAYLSGSFPSGHMTAMGAIGPFLWARSRWLMLPLLAAGLAACYGLVTQQAHFVSDLFGGLLVGGSVGYAVRCAAARR